MTEKKSKILLVEDEAPLAALYMQYLKDEDVTVTHATTGAAAKKILLSDPPDAMLLDVRLPDMEGTELFNTIKENNLSTTVIVITAHGSINIAVETMRVGAYDFLVKPFNRQRLIDTLKGALSCEKIRREVQTETRKIPNRSIQKSDGFIGESEPMRIVYRMIENAANSKATVFITGESGTGKEVCAESIHRLSNRSKKPLVILNCAAIPKDLMESEIFGHVKGAFTGAITNHDGAATQADGGTLFLDEICEMDLHLQSKLLRFIQTETFQKVGGAKSETVNIRFICATNRDPLAEISAGRFREDLYYRLHVIPMHLPPLRDRGEDILKISQKFLIEYAREERKSFRDFDPGVKRHMSEYTWPGNVRQLQNVIRNTVVLNEGKIVSLDMLPPPLNNQTNASNNLSQQQNKNYYHNVVSHALSSDILGGSITMPSAPSESNQSQWSENPNLGIMRPHRQDQNRSSEQPMYHDAFASPTSSNSMSSDGGRKIGNLNLGSASVAAPVQDLVGRGYVIPDKNNYSASRTIPDSQSTLPLKKAAKIDHIVPLWETEKHAIEEAIRGCGGNIPKAAALLGISASTIYRKKHQWENN